MTITAKSRDVSSARRDLSTENTPDNPLVQALRRQVANGFVLYANYKHSHWHTYGPHFRDMHKLFDTFSRDVLETIDELAERIRMIGQDPPAHLIEALDLSTVPVAAPHATMREMIEEANRNQLVVIHELRNAAALADEHADPGTVDLLSKTVRIHEKHEWWTRDILREGGELRA